MMKGNHRPPPKKLTRCMTGEFDGEGLRHVLLAAIEAVYESSPHVTLPQMLVATAVLVAEREGKPHTLASLVKRLNMPFSTASRVVWSLTDEGGPIGILAYEPHPTDRRKKLIVMQQNKQDNEVPKRMMRAMIDYYGDSVKHLVRRADNGNGQALPKNASSRKSASVS